MSIHRVTLRDVLKSLEGDIKEMALSTEWDGDVSVIALLEYLTPIVEEIERLARKIEELDHRTGGLITFGPIPLGD